MQVMLHVWPECVAAFRAEGGLPMGEGPIEVSADQLAALTDHFDVQVRTMIGTGSRRHPAPPPSKVLSIAPLGRGFGQR